MVFGDKNYIFLAIVSNICYYYRIGGELVHFIEEVPSDINDIILFKNKAVRGRDMLEMHSHSYHELYFLLSGERRYFVGHEIYDVEPGDLVLIPGDTLHRTTSPAKRGYERYVLYFNEDDISDFVSGIGKEVFDEFINKGCITLPVEQSDIVRRSLELIEREDYKHDFLTHSIKKNVLEQIILVIIRHGEKKEKVKREAEDKMEQIARHISENYKSEITLSEVAAMAYMEETYFSKKFKKLTGFGFKEYLIYTRIKAAQKMLWQTDASVTEISDTCGFSSSNYFGDVFKRYIGVSPSEYRRSVVKK